MFHDNTVKFKKNLNAMEFVENLPPISYPTDRCINAAIFIIGKVKIFDFKLME